MGPALLIGLSTVRFRSNQSSHHEVHIDEEQLRWFEETVKQHRCTSALRPRPAAPPLRPISLFAVPLPQPGPHCHLVVLLLNEYVPSFFSLPFSAMPTPASLSMLPTPASLSTLPTPASLSTRAASLFCFCAAPCMSVLHVCPLFLHAAMSRLSSSPTRPLLGAGSRFSKISTSRTVVAGSTTRVRDSDLLR